MWARILAIVLGLWLEAAPAVLGYGGLAAKGDRVVAPLIVGFAVVAVAEVMRPLRWVTLVLGIWLIIQAWTFGYPPAAAANASGVGVVVAICAFVRGVIRQRYGGGWSALMRTPVEQTED